MILNITVWAIHFRYNLKQPLININTEFLGFFFFFTLPTLFKLGHALSSIFLLLSISADMFL